MIKKMMLLVVMLFSLVVPMVVGADDGALILEDLRLERQVDVFGIEQVVLRGRILNAYDVPHRVDAVLVDALDEEGTFIGEGYGYVVDACDVALFDVHIQPERHVDFFVPMELDELSDDLEAFDLTQWAFVVQAVAVPDALMPMPELPDGVRMITDAEVVSVEWQDATNLHYGVGCDGRLAMRHRWYAYDLLADSVSPLEAYPRAGFITEPFISRTSINILTQGQVPDETLIERSYLTAPMQSNRVIWQDDLNNIFTSERDGNFKRVVHPRLYTYSLQGFGFSPAGNFVAYYFGAFGEPVRWFTASMDGTLISAMLDNNPLSQTVPGLTNDGQRVIISGDYEEGLGYYLQTANRASRQWLFGMEALPGNNYPAPVYRLVDASTRYIYFVLPQSEGASLVCYHLETATRHHLADLPLRLRESERAWSWLSPDGAHLVISANGLYAGAWLVDLSAFDACP